MKWNIQREQVTGEVRVEITHMNKETGKTTTLSNETLRTDPIEMQRPYAVLKGMTGVTLCQGFQSVRMDIGADLPWPCTMGSTEGLKEGYEVLFAMADQELQQRSEDLQELISQIVQKFGNRGR